MAVSTPDAAARRSLSLWHDTLPDDDLVALRQPLPGHREADVAIVGAGLTGLWTAYALTERDPDLRIVLLEQEFAGFGASGRNGGWCSGLLPIGLDALARRHGRPAALAFQRAAQGAVDDVGRVVAGEDIDCHFAKGGYLRLARSPVQAQRLRADLDHQRSWEQTEDDVTWLDRAAARDRVAADGVFGALWTPHCAALHPARLARGLARVVEQRGVVIHEQTPVTRIEPGVAVTPHGSVRADIVVRATEGYTSGLPGLRRALLPLYSMVIATEPLPDDVWRQLGWGHRDTVNDDRHFLIYAQRSGDGRIVIGGRGTPYHFGSRVMPAFDRDARVFEALQLSLLELFPLLAEVTVTHRWGGVLGIPRDWHPSVRLDRSTGLASAGGYSGDGVALTNLAGRTLADLVTGAQTELATLPWVGHNSRAWEPEPLRWLGINGGFRLADSIDRAEERTGRSARLRTAVMSRLLGH